MLRSMNRVVRSSRNTNRQVVVAGWFILLCVSVHADSLRVSGDRLFVAVEINGLTVDALLDSAAEMTIVDTTFAERLRLSPVGNETARGTGGTTTARFAEHVDIRCAGVRLEDRTVAIIDLSDISRRLVGTPVELIIGRDLFDSARFFLDIEKRVFRPVATDEVPEGKRLTLHDHRGIKQFRIGIGDDQGVLADFDLGNGSEMLVGQDYAEHHGLLREDRIIGEKQGGGLGGSLSRTLVSLDSVTVGEAEFGEVVAAVDPTEDAPDANVGVSILRNFVIIVDFADNALWLAKRQAGD